MFSRLYLSPLGTLRLGYDATYLREVRFVDAGDVIEPTVERATGTVLSTTLQWLDNYFEGRSLAFEPVLFLDGTDFQKSVWWQLRHIPFGRTVTYKELAKSMGLSPLYARAVGTAVARNPILLILPCHRVVPSRGGTGGYAGGVWRKAALIERERSASCVGPT